MEFAYHQSSFKGPTGERTSSHHLSQLYGLTFGSYLLDPRLLVFDAGVNYNIITSGSSPDNTILSYNFSANFFPGRLISFGGLATKSVQHIDNTTLLQGYDVTRTVTGARFTFNGPRLGMRNGNRNNYSNNYNNNARSAFPYPTIHLSQTRTEAESLSTVNPLHEILDQSKATMNYRFGQSFMLDFDGRRDDYRNMVGTAGQGEYQTTSGDLQATIKPSVNDMLRVRSTFTDRAVQNIANFDAKDRTWSVGTSLDHSAGSSTNYFYSYNFTKRDTTSYELILNTGQAQVRYKYSDTIYLWGGLDYARSSFDRPPNPAIVGDVGEKHNIQTAGVVGRAEYSREYRPKFMGPFALSTGYSIAAGYSSLSVEVGGLREGNGRNYTNTVNIGINSVGWKRDNIGLAQSVSSRRDHSPLDNNVYRSSSQLNLSTSRVPRSLITGSVLYTAEKNQGQPGLIFAVGGVGTIDPVSSSVERASLRRSLKYDIKATHSISEYLTLSEGAYNASSKRTSYSLSTLPSISELDDKVYYVSARYFYPITRSLLFSADLRNELRNGKQYDLNSLIAELLLKYRIRSITASIEYRWRQDSPENSPSYQQQYLFARLSRPF